MAEPPIPEMTTPDRSGEGSRPLRGCRLPSSHADCSWFGRSSISPSMFCGSILANDKKLSRFI